MLRYWYGMNKRFFDISSNKSPRFKKWMKQPLPHPHHTHVKLWNLSKTAIKLPSDVHNKPSANFPSNQIWKLRVASIQPISHWTFRTIRPNFHEFSWANFISKSHQSLFFSYPISKYNIFFYSKKYQTRNGGRIKSFSLLLNFRLADFQWKPFSHLHLLQNMNISLDIGGSISRKSSQQNDTAIRPL